MSDTSFRALVAAYEHASRHEPRRFAFGTAAMAAFGYAAVIGTLALAALGLSWGVRLLVQGHVNYLVFLIVTGCASLLWSLGGALMSRQKAPEGVPVTRAEAPRLFRLIDKVRRRCGAPMPDVVLIDGEMNAALAQVPRLGLLGWHRSYLVLGLPLLMALDVEQLAGVIAHEFGHLRGAHGKLGAWVYRTRRSWWKLADARERTRVKAWIADAAVGFFFRTFFPRFNARAFVLARQQEYEADRVAHAVAGNRACAEGLIALSLHARFLDDCFWPGILAGASHAASPQTAPYARMRQQLRDALPHPQAPRWLNEALKRLPHPADTHPSLRDRLEFAEVQPRVPETAPVSAADALLRDDLPAWIERIDARWKEAVAEGWSQLHRTRQGQLRLVGELEAGRAAGVLSADDHLLWARAARAVGGAEAETPVLRRMLADHPESLEARFELGATLVEDADAAVAAEGAELLRQVADAASRPQAFQAGKRYERWLEQHERYAELKAWRERLRAIEAAGQTAWEAFHDVEGRQQLTAHGLGPRALAPLLDVLRRERAVGRAYVVRKFVPDAPGWRFCLVVVERASGFGQPDPETWGRALSSRIELPCLFTVIDLGHPYWKDDARSALVRQITGMPGACVYSGRKT